MQQEARRVPGPTARKFAFALLAALALYAAWGGA